MHCYELGINPLKMHWSGRWFVEAAMLHHYLEYTGPCCTDSVLFMCLETGYIRSMPYKELTTSQLKTAATGYKLAL